MALVLDTGPLYASLDRRDADHQACRRLIEQTSESLVIPVPVLVEVDCWVRKWLHVGALVALLDDVADGAYLVEDLLPQDYRRVRAICDRYADARRFPVEQEENSAMTFELWDLTTRNVTGFFESEAEALAAVREAVERHGRTYAEAFALVREDARGRSRTIARGADLVDRALAASAPRGGRISA